MSLTGRSMQRPYGVSRLFWDSPKGKKHKKMPVIKPASY
ncbi:hypothetical protein L581_3906 [Serratia fonticola AU-AP2C]|nr:hypothetical protein L581_3906 [Serratia fonticola AU-AP2C]